MTCSGLGCLGSDVLYGTAEIEVVLREQFAVIDVMSAWTVALSDKIRYVFEPSGGWNGASRRIPPGREELVGSPYYGRR
jgi:hypothetical protein